MTRLGLVCLLFVTLAWGQAPTTPAPASQPSPNPASPAAPPNPTGEPDLTKVPADAAVVTINGLCDNPPADPKAGDCKTVISRADFDKLVDAIQPNMQQRARRQFATRYSSALVMSRKAEQLGLDKDPKFQERMQLARTQILSQQLNQALQEKASQVSDADIEDYYKKNSSEFEEAELTRIFIPHIQQLPTPKVKLTDAQDKKRTEVSEATMKSEATKLHARAVAGESFNKLQEEAFVVAGIKSKSPTTSMGKVRRSNLPPGQVAAMDLPTGKISDVMSDQSGYFIYKAGAKDTPPLDQVKDEIRGTLVGEHMQAAMKEVQDSATPVLNNDYFGPEGPAGPMGRGMMPRPARPNIPVRPPAPGTPPSGPQ